jgi:hypothetical protein
MTFDARCRLYSHDNTNLHWHAHGRGSGDRPTSLALVQTGRELPVGLDTGIRLTTPDARAAHAYVIELGLDAGELLDWETTPLMFSFTDYDGNRFYVSQV